MQAEGKEQAVRFVHLRVHSAYSLLEGALPLKTVMKLAVADRQPAIAVTDTNNLFCALEFSQKAVGEGSSRSSAASCRSIWRMVATASAAAADICRRRNRQSCYSPPIRLAMPISCILSVRPISAERGMTVYI